MISRFILWILFLLLALSTGLNVYQIRLFSTEDVKQELNENVRSINGNTSDRQTFVLEIDLDQDGYKTARSNPFWVKQKIGNILNIEARRFESLIQTFCYYIESEGIDVKNCIDEVKVWVQPIEDREEAYIAITGKPVDSPGVDVSKICKKQLCRSFRLIHLSREGKKTFIAGDSGFQTIQANEKNMRFELIKISQSGILAWTRKIDWYGKDIATTDLSLYLSTGRSIVESLRIPIAGSWTDADCMDVTDDEPIKFKEECGKQFDSDLLTSFKNSPFWSPGDLALNNSLNAKGTPVRIIFDRDLNQYVLPEQIEPGIKELLLQMSYQPYENKASRN
ncbi:MAG: hypothetical protein CBB82_03940 [Betaproteobacteria bacterium TMED22]|nr:MAG: hypothetical protein CBB82_03940 [Betaproteobacteria bacterium TMED22]